MGVCTTGGVIMKKKRWSSPGSRCDIHQAPGHPRILLPLCVLPNSPASGLASSHSGVARNDSHRTVSSTASFHGFLPCWRSLKPPLFPSPFSLPLTFTHPLIIIALCTHTKPGIESPSRSESNSTCQRNSSLSRKCSKARLGKGVGRSPRKRDQSQVVVPRLRLSATAPCSELSCPIPMPMHQPEKPFRIWI